MTCSRGCSISCVHTHASRAPGRGGGPGGRSSPSPLMSAPASRSEGQWTVRGDMTGHHWHDRLRQSDCQSVPVMVPVMTKAPHLGARSPLLMG
eukprot:1193955-Prorocentrum_minimum.AAC.2